MAVEKLAFEDNQVLSVSIVSHGQIALVKNLLSDLQVYCVANILEVLLTFNIAEPDGAVLQGFGFPIRRIVNEHVRGFGDNHNRAFSQAKGEFFCVLNPDIRLSSNPFPAMLRVAGDGQSCVVGPLVFRSDGRLEDSARAFPTPAGILVKMFTQRSPMAPVGPEGDVDWIGGMCMVFPCATYSQLGGFDARYFLYYEDVDLCFRLHLKGGRVRVCSAASVIHDAQRSSHRSLRYLRWHVVSMLRFFLSSGYAKVRRRWLA